MLSRHFTHHAVGGFLLLVSMLATLAVPPWSSRRALAAVRGEKRVTGAPNLATLVGDTGIEPVTSSVSSNDHGSLCCMSLSCYQSKQSIKVRACPSSCVPIVTHLDNQTPQPVASTSP